MASLPDGPAHLVVALDDVAELCTLAAPGSISALCCDVGDVTRADLDHVAAMARLALWAGRRRVPLSFENACPHLAELVGLAGLHRIVALAERSAESVGKAETRHQP